ncbi:MAG: CHAT domain-containing protein [Balneolales bacterium]|nr:CHAT domain-containing protein [Balneolales bacterium]
MEKIRCLLLIATLAYTTIAGTTPPPHTESLYTAANIYLDKNSVYSGLYESPSGFVQNLHPRADYLVKKDAFAAVNDSSAVFDEWLQEYRRMRNTGYPAESLIYLEKMEAFASRHPDIEFIYPTLLEYARYYSFTGNYSLALDYNYRNINNVERFMDPETEVYHFRMHNLHHNLSNVYSEMGQYQNALNYQRAAFGFRDNFNASAYDWCLGYFFKGRIHYLIGNRSEAIRYMLQATELLDEAGSEVLRFQVVNTMGNLQYDTGNNDAALVYYSKAYNIAGDLGNNWIKGQISSNIGGIYLVLEDFGQAEKYILEAVELLSTVDSPQLGGAYLQLLSFYIGRSQTEEARKWLTKTREHLQGNDSTRFRRELYFFEGNFYKQSGDHQLAEESYLAYLALTRETDERADPRLYWMRAFNMMHLDVDKALQLGDEAAEYTFTYRNESPATGQFRTFFIQHLSHHFAELAAVYERRGDPDRAFRIIESYKSRSFAEDLMMDDEALFPFMSAEQRNRYQNLSGEIESLENQLLAGNQNTDHDYTVLHSETERAIEEIKLRKELITTDVLRANPHIQSFKEPALAGLRDIQRDLGRGEGAIQFSVSAERITGFIITRNGVYSWQKNIDRDNQLELVNSLRESIVSIAPLEEVNAMLAEAALQIFSENALNLIWILDSVTISTDGILAFIPFEALRFNNKYFTESFSIRQVPSFTIESILRERRKHRELAGNIRAMAVVNPIMGGSMDERRAIFRDDIELRALPFSKLEGDWIKQFFPGETTLISGADATEKAIRSKELSRYRLLHFASHGLLDERNPAFSGIVLSVPDGENDTTDGFLRTSEIYQLRLNADLVVLSACNTGIGRIVNGEGVLGFQRAFLFAGSDAVAVTLWSVEDRSTSLLMRSFYRNLASAAGDIGSRLTYETALRMARVELMQQSAYRHPIHWASFVFTGI